MREGIIRTPLAPYETFKDDPLRILRAVRFAARFGYKIAPEMEQAAQYEDIKLALCTIISKERVGEEVRKMLDGPRPLRAMELLQRFGIYRPLLRLENEDERPPSHEQHAIHMTRAASILLQDSDIVKQCFEVDRLPVEERRHLFLACMLYPYRHHPGNIDPYPLQLGKLALKLSGHESIQAQAMLTHVDHVTTFLDEFDRIKNVLVPGTPEWKRFRVRLGHHVRVAGKTLHQWHPLILLFSIAHTAVRDHAEGVSSALIDRHVELFRCMQRMDVVHAYEMRPILSGVEILELASQVAGFEVAAGPWLGALIERVVEWQLEEDGPGMEEHCNPDACKKFILNYFQREQVQFKQGKATDKRKRK